MCPNVDIRKVYFYLWLFGVFVAAQTFLSSCSEQGLLSGRGVRASLAGASLVVQHRL